MKTVSTKRELRELRGAAQGTVVLVPTMGALHAGHRSLMVAGRKRAGADGMVIVSIFVNPTQFNQAADLENYPSTLEADLELCEEAGVDLVFAPSVAEVYPGDASVVVTENVLSGTLCGATRPGHFDGVCTVVLKLYNMVQPNVMMFGQKDFQQVAVITRMVRDLDIPVEIIPVPTVREESGLALSSRNTRLSPTAAAEAPQLYAALRSVRVQVESGEVAVNQVEQALREELSELETELRYDYVSLVDAETMQEVNPGAASGRELILAVAVFFGQIRLIDHIRVQL